MKPTNSKLYARFKKYGIVALANDLGVRHPAVCQWLKKGVVPPLRCQAVAKLTGMALSDLNPKVFR